MNRNDVSRLKLAEIMHLAVSCMEDREYRITCTRMEGHGFRSLGSGNYGRAFAHDEIPGWVIKLSGRVDGDSFPAYVYWCIANPMPNVPEYHFPVFSESRELFMVMMPQYTDLSTAIDSGWMEGTPDVKEYEAARKGIYGHALPKESADFVGAWEAGRAIGEFFEGLVQFDMHSGNVMRDPLTDNLIITDPIHLGDNDSMIASITGKKQFQYMHQLEMFPTNEVQPRPSSVPQFRKAIVPEVNFNHIPQFLLEEGRAVVKARARRLGQFNADFEAVANFIQRGLGDVQIKVRNNPDAQVELPASFGRIEKHIKKHISTPAWNKEQPPLEKLMVNGHRTASPAELKKLAGILNRHKDLDKKLANQRISIMLPRYMRFKAKPQDPAITPEVVSMSVRQAIMLRNKWFPRGFKNQHFPEWTQHV